MKRPHINDPETAVFRRNTLQVLDEVLDRLENGLGYVEADALWDDALKLRNAMAEEFNFPGVTREKERTNNWRTTPDWHNPDKLTDDEIGTDKGWRLRLKSEKKAKNDEWYDGSNWVLGCSSDNGILYSSVTYRTRSAIPA